MFFFLSIFIFSWHMMRAEIEINDDDYWFDCSSGSFLGCRDASPAIDTQVRRILHEINSPLEHSLRIRKLSRSAIYNGMTKYNACVISYGTNHYLYISEKWFNSLSDPEQRFLIGHEIMHLECQHQLRKVKNSLSIGLLAALCGYGITLSLVDSFSTALKVALCSFYGVTIPLSCSLSREYESEADREACLRLNAKEGGILLMKRMLYIEKKFKSDFPSWQWFKTKQKIAKWLSTPFRTHPPTKERLAQIEALPA